MTRRLLLTYMALAALVLVALELPLAIVYARSQKQELTARVERDAVTIATLAQDAVTAPAGERRELRETVGRYQQTTGGRVVIVTADGELIVDSDPPVPGNRSFSSRPEIAVALQEGRVVTGERFSRTLGYDLLYVATPIARSGRILGAVRVTYPTSTVSARIRRYYAFLAIVAIVVLAATAFIGRRFATSIATPLERVRGAAQVAGDGDLSIRAAEDEGPPEVRSLARSFNDMVGRLDELVRAQDEFVADASHQLRTPLTAVRLRLENLERDVAPEGRADLDAALSEIGRLSRLIDGLLALARSEPGGAETETVDVGALIEGRIEAWEPLAREGDVRLAHDVAGHPTALARADNVEQVIDNLLGNALGVAPAGSVIAVTARPRSERVEIHVIDEGPGMDAEQRERAFDRLWRAERTGGGTGLGLAIVRRLTEADGGRVELREAGGGGLDAVITLRAGDRIADPGTPARRHA